MTVPPWFGWEEILAALMLLVIVAVAAVVILVAAKAGSERSEWQAWLNGRSARRRNPAADRDAPSTRSSEAPLRGGGQDADEPDGRAIGGRGASLRVHTWSRTDTPAPTARQ
jgi:hypothetical protein